MKPLSFSIANFKAFGSNVTEIPLRPITLVFGPNSSGKSSLIQALLYFNEALKTNELDIATVCTAGGKIDLGGFRHTLNRRSDAQHFVYGMTFSCLSTEYFSWERNITIHLTLGPLSKNGPLGCNSFTIEANGEEFLKASRHGDGPMKVDMLVHGVILEIIHPFLEKVLPEDDSEEIPGNANRIREFIHYQLLWEYLDYAVSSGSFEIDCDGIFPTSFRMRSFPSVKNMPEKIRLMERPTKFFLVPGDERDAFTVPYEESATLPEFVKRYEKEFRKIFKTKFPDLFNDLFISIWCHMIKGWKDIRHVPPLRELPPRVFDLNHHPDPLWKTIAENEDLRARINKWFGADFMKSRYALQVREFTPLDEISQRVPQALESHLMKVLGSEGFGDGLDDVLDQLRSDFEKLDKIQYLHSHPELYEELVQYELVTRMDMAASDGPFADEDRQFLSLPPRDQRKMAEQYVEDAVFDVPTLSYVGMCVWEHYKNHRPELIEFLSDKVDITKEAADLYDRIAPEQIEKRKEIALMELPSNIKVSLQDVGVGISQVLPVLMNAFGETGSLIAIEQPEIHIHPALQAELGDVFIESALGENKNTFLLETHSEHLILRLLRRIRETTEGDREDWPEALRKACPNGIRPEDVAVLYVEPGEEGAKVRELPVDANGEFTCNWPGGFFEERMKELF